jgi:regulator of protease activity HflC (stomatin/prohibitin superfamily)
MNNPFKLIISAIVLIVALVLTLTSFKVVTIEGSQLGIKETWSHGVEADIMQPKTYFLFPGWSQTVYKYDASSQVYVMNDKPMAQEKMSAGREKDAYLVQSSEGQDMKISMNLRWRIDPAKLVSIHKTVRGDISNPGHIEEKILRPVVMRVVKDEATRMKAIEAYSGEGLVKLQSSIQNALAGSDAVEGKELRERGVIVENFVIEHIGLDPQYMEQISKKTTAIQSQQRAIEEQKAAEADALVAKSKAQADLNTQVVAGERDAKLVVIKAKAAAEQVTVAAEAAAQQVTIAAKAAATQVEVAAEASKKQAELQGEGKKLGMTAEAEGILAVGKAEAAAKQLLLQSYMTAGTNAYVTVEVAKALSSGYQNIQGYLPNNFNPTILSDNFMGAIRAVVAPTPVAK